MKKTLLVIVVFLLFWALAYMVHLKIWSLKGVDYQFVGKFNYEILDKKLFNETYMSGNSYGVLTADLPIRGIEIKNAERIDKEQDYIFSFKHPIKAVYANTKGTEGQEQLKKKPIKIIQDQSTHQDYLFVYVLKPGGKYRLLLP